MDNYLNILKDITFDDSYKHVDGESYNDLTKLLEICHVIREKVDSVLGIDRAKSNIKRSIEFYKKYNIINLSNSSNKNYLDDLDRVELIIELENYFNIHIPSYSILEGQKNISIYDLAKKVEEACKNT